MLLQALCPDQDVLLQRYVSTVSSNTLLIFKQKGIDLCQLKQWQLLYPIVYPWDPEYNTVRLNYNKAGQFFPLFIIFCAKKTQVQFALTTALKYKIEFVIRSGGHDSNNYSLCDGIIIDMTPRNFIKVKDNIASIGAGARNGEIVTALAPYNMVLPTGTCQNVAISGITLGGGFGFLERQFGLTLDNLLETRVLLASGDVVTANEQQNSDLYWACRGGGGGSLGVNLDFKFRIHKVDKIVLFNLLFEDSQFTKVLKLWQEWAPHTNKRLTSELDVMSFRNQQRYKLMCHHPQDHLQDKEEKRVVRVTGQFLGSRTELKTLIKVFDCLSPEKAVWYASIEEAATYYATPYPKQFGFFRNLFVENDLEREAVKILDEFFKRSSVGLSMEMNAMKGKIESVPVTETAFPWRTASYWVLIRGYTNSQEELDKLSRQVIWLYQQLLDAGARNKETGLARAYVNFKDPKLNKKEYPLAYWGCNAERLTKVKQNYDPENVFHFAQSIPL